MIIRANPKDGHKTPFFPYEINEKALISFWNCVAEKGYIYRIGMYQFFGFVQGKGFLHGISRIEQNHSA